MSERDKIKLADVPDPGKLSEHGVSIDAPTPTQFAIPDPWAPSNGRPAGNVETSAPAPDPDE